MTNETFFIEDIGVEVQSTMFQPKGGLAERRIMLRTQHRCDNFAEQYRRVSLAIDHVLTERAKGFRVFCKRYFVSDIANQLEYIADADQRNVSVIQQPPLDGSKVVVSAFLVSGEPQHQHIWTSEVPDTDTGIYAQTADLLAHYKDMLEQRGATMEANAIRTWFYVRDVDTTYMGMVNARKDFFRTEGLTKDTHYLASTGIQGTPSPRTARVQLDTYSIADVQPGQQQYLYAPTHLNPTYEYGVTFERGVKVRFGDRSHIYISGTASINNKGEVVHEGDIVNQTKRMLENVKALLAEGGATEADVMQVIVYLRDVADYETVRQIFAEHYPDTPRVITIAPVCRPAWLIEMECVAATADANSRFKNF